MSFDIKKLNLEIPDEWEHITVSDIAGINEKTIRKGEELDYIKYIDISSVSTNEIEEPKQMLYSEAPSRAKRIVKKGDILISTVRPNLKQYFIWDFKVDNHIASTGFCIISPYEEKHKWYLYSFLTSEIFNEYLVRVADGAAYPAFSYKEIRDAVIPMPDDKTLDLISELSYSLFKRIHLNQQTNQTLESIAQAIFKSWFINFDPVRAKIRANEEGQNPERAAMAAIAGVSLSQSWDEIEAALDQKLSTMTEAQREQLNQMAALFPDELVESELGEIPKGWEVKSLDEVADYLNGRAMQKYPPEEGKDTLPVLKISQLRKGDTLDADIASAVIPERFKVYNGDVIFSWSGSLLVDLWCGGDAALNQHLFKVRSEDYEKWFYYLWTKHHLDNFIRIAEAKAVTMGHIKRSHLKEAKCVIPSKELLNSGKKLIGPLLDKVIQLRLESKKLEGLRDTLLPKLISGKIEV